MEGSPKARGFDHASKALELGAMRGEHVARGLAEFVIRRSDGTLNDAEKGRAARVAFDHFGQA
jgi:hypothetical protein